MRILLTSFGIHHILQDEVKETYPNSIFYRLPPVSFHQLTNRTMSVDYSMLLLAEQIIVDRSSIEVLPKLFSRESSIRNSYEKIATTINVLESEGFVEIASYEDILMDHKKDIDQLVKADLQEPSVWFEPLLQSMEIWRHHTHEFVNILKRESQAEGSDLDHDMLNSLLTLTHMGQNNMGIIPMLIQFYKTYMTEDDQNTLQASDRFQRLTDTLKEYLYYVNSNVLLATKTNSSFHDWNDFSPFYGKKLHTEKSNLQNKQKAANALFEIAFPEYAIADDKTLVKVLKDKRVKDLRVLIQEAAEGKVEFDVNFARSVFKEVFKLEQKTSRYRNITSYLTMPLDLIPGVGNLLAKATEEIAGKITDREVKKDYRWFYMLSNVSEQKD